MSIQDIQALPTAEELDEQFPIGSEHRVQEYRAQTQDILARRDPRYLMITGPCSAWPPEAVDEYTDRLARLQEEVRDQILCIMRVYIQKPRTALGWPGPHNQPDPLAPPNICEGIILCRRMMDSVAKRVPIMDEMLDPDGVSLFGPLMTDIAVGARSTQNSKHRQVASGLDVPVSIKNPTSGSIEVGVDGVQVAQHANDFVLRGRHVRSSGNPYAHLILRGGKPGPNYDPQSLALAANLLTDPDRGIQNPAIVIDASHDNCKNGNGKDPELQCVVLDSVMAGVLRRREEYELVRGFMLESFLRGGKQPIGPDMRHDGTSITDPCLSWERTEAVIRELAEKIARIR